MYFGLSSLLELHPHPISSKLHSNGLLEAHSWIHNEGHFLGELSKNPDIHVVTPHHVHNFYATGHVRREHSLAISRLEQILENIGLANEVVFVFVDETKHETQDF